MYKKVYKKKKKPNPTKENISVYKLKHMYKKLYKKKIRRKKETESHERKNKCKKSIRNFTRRK
jgi:hypothetical protein